MCFRDKVGCQRVPSALVLQKLVTTPKLKRDPLHVVGVVLPKAGGGLQCGEKREGKAGRSWGVEVTREVAQSTRVRKTSTEALGLCFKNYEVPGWMAAEPCR